MLGFVNCVVVVYGAPNTPGYSHVFCYLVEQKSAYTSKNYIPTKTISAKFLQIHGVHWFVI